MIDEHVRKPNRTHGAAAVEESLPDQIFQYMTAKSAHRALLHRDEHLVIPHELLYQVGIERFHETRIRDRCRDADGSEQVRGLHALRKPCTKRQQSCRGTFADDATAANLEDLAFGRNGRADAFAARITNR